MEDVKLAQENRIPRRQWSVEEKQRHYDRWEKSELSRQKYCRQHQLSPKTFSGWIKQFQNTHSKKMAFVSMPLKNHEAIENQSLEIKLPNGILCRFSQSWDKVAMMNIVRSLHAIGD